MKNVFGNIRTNISDYVGFYVRLGKKIVERSTEKEDFAFAKWVKQEWNKGPRKTYWAIVGSFTFGTAFFNANKAEYFDQSIERCVSGGFSGFVFGLTHPIWVPVIIIPSVLTLTKKTLYFAQHFSEIYIT